MIKLFSASARQITMRMSALQQQAIDSRGRRCHTMVFKRTLKT